MASDWSVVCVPASGWLVRARIMVTQITDPQLPRSQLSQGATGVSSPAPALGSTASQELTGDIMQLTSGLNDGD